MRPFGTAGAKMSDLNGLEARLDAAFSTIEKRLLNGGGGEAGLADALARIAELEAENRDLSDSLDALNAERAKDLAQLDTLIAQLRPLVEEAV